jgi:hypothetical protein
MIFLTLFILSSILWQEDFTDTTVSMSQLYDYSIDISYEEGIVSLAAHPQLEGAAAAWFYVDEDISFSADDALRVVIKVRESEVRLRYLYRREGRTVYFGGDEVISPSDEWQRVQIPLTEGRPFYSSNYPYALTPGKEPCLFIFIDNLVPGDLDVQIDNVSVSRSESSGGER